MSITMRDESVLQVCTLVNVIARQVTTDVFDPIRLSNDAWRLIRRWDLPKTLAYQEIDLKLQ